MRQTSDEEVAVHTFDESTEWQGPAPAAPQPVDTPRVRGGLGLFPLFTGAMVTAGAALVFALLARSIGDYVNYRPYRLPVGGTHGTGLVAIAAAGLGLLLAGLWGGYTTGRMARGKGWVHGLLMVATLAVLSVAGLAIASLLRPGPGLDLKFRLPAGYPHVKLLLPRWVDALTGAGLLLAGAVLGGGLGERWHTRLERREARKVQEAREARESFADLRAALSAPTPDHSEYEGGDEGTYPPGYPAGAPTTTFAPVPNPYASQGPVTAPN